MLELRTPRPAALALTIAVLAGAAASAQQKPDFSGIWQLNREISDDVKAQIEKAAGPASMKGGGYESDRWFPRGGGGSEVDRIQLRRALIQRASEFDSLTIEQTAQEFKVLGAESSVRIFAFGRPSTRQPDGGPRLTATTRWDGEQLVVEESGKDGWKTVEVYTLVPGGERMNLALRFESKLFEKPVDLKLGYLRAKPEGGGR